MELLSSFIQKEAVICVLTVLGILIVMRFVNTFINRLSSRLILKTDDRITIKHVETVKNIFLSASRAFFAIILILYVSNAAGFNLKPYLAAAGLVSVAVGFGAKRLIEDLITGLSLFVEKQIRVGDVVKVAGIVGNVEAVTLKTLILRDFEGHVHYIRNSLVDVVCNLTRDYAWAVIEIGVDYSANLDFIFEVLNETLVKIKDENPDIVEQTELLGLDRFEDSAMIIILRIKLNDSAAQWRIKRVFNKLLKEEFDKNGISIPFNKLVVKVKN